MKIKEISKGFDAREKIKRGIDKAVAAVAPTLGAVGMSAIIDMGGDYSPVESDDGVTVLKNLQFEDRYEQIGMLMLKKAAQRTNDEGGDGTSTTAVLAHALIEEAYKEIGHSNEKIFEVAERLDRGLEECKAKLLEYKRDVQEDDIERVATISSLDAEIGRIIAEAYKKIGKDGIITVEDSPTIGYSSEVVQGTRFTKGFQSPYFINDHERYQSILENPHILIVDRRISSNSQITKIMEGIIKSGNNNVLVIADSVDGEALASLVLNHQRKILNICVVNPPHTLNLKKEWLRDIAALTDATVVSEEAGVLMENIDMSYLGQAEKVIVTKDHTTIVNGAGNTVERVASLRAQLAESTSEMDKTTLKERIASLTGGIGVIRVGAITDTELRAKKYKIEDAVNATKAALEEGIVIGGGACLAKIATEMSDPMFKKALVTPLRQMAVNAGFNTKFWKKHMNADNLVGYVQEKPAHIGYDFKEMRSGDLFETGVIDPVKVTRLALESAVSVTKSLVRGETVIIELPDKDEQ